MAGIGFEISRLMQPRTYRGVLKAYGYAALISSGPWVLSMVSIAGLGLLLKSLGNFSNLDAFFVAITHIFAFSLVATGPVQLVIARYAADLIYAKEESKIMPAVVGALFLNLSLSAIVGLIFFGFFVPASPKFQLGSTAVLMCVSAIWTTSNFISAIKNYTAVVVCFAIGYTVSLGAAWGLGVYLADAGAMIGFGIGQAVLLLCMLAVIQRRFGGASAPDFAFLNYFRLHPALALCGFTYNLGIWIDKPLHWWLSPHGHQVAGALYASPLYDQATFLSFLSIAPGMAIFLLTVETSFAQHYADFFRHVVARGSLRKIIESKLAMIDSLRTALSRLIKFQGAITIGLMLGAERLLQALGLGSVQTLVFQFTLLGVCMLVIFLALLTVLFYLDRVRDALICCATFALINFGLTLTGLWIDERWYGLGFTAAAGVAAIIAASMANKALRQLDYHTFTSQPIYP